jgi:3-methyladenine DNA glycosylase AlkD
VRAPLILGWPPVAFCRAPGRWAFSAWHTFDVAVKQARPQDNIDALAQKTLASLTSAATKQLENTKNVVSDEQVLGLRTPQIRAVSDSLYAEVRTWNPEYVLKLVDGLLGERMFEARQVAYEVLGRHRAARQILTAADLARLGRGLDDWTAVDVFAGQVAGPAWRDGQISDELVMRWAKSADLWWRRCALVCTVALNQAARGGSGDTRRTLKICEMLIGDREDMVVKALSWALRELIPYDPAAVNNFLKKHAASLPRRVVREVESKLKTGLKRSR